MTSERRIPLGVLVLLICFVVVIAALIFVMQGQAQPGTDSPEAGFSRDMSVHHAQAVEMAILLYDRSENAELKGVALDMALTQQAQIGQMQGWLSLWGLPIASITAPMIWMDMEITGQMPGMATEEQLAALAAAQGVEADRLFITLMITHHESGIHMAEAILARTQNAVVRRLAQGIVETQQYEISLLRAIEARLS